MNDDTSYYFNPSKLFYSNFIDVLIDKTISLINLSYIHFVIAFVAWIMFLPLILFWFILDLIGNVLDYLTYHYSVTFIIWGIEKTK